MVSCDFMILRGDNEKGVRVFRCNFNICFIGSIIVVGDLAYPVPEDDGLVFRRGCMLGRLPRLIGQPLLLLPADDVNVVFVYHDLGRVPSLPARRVSGFAHHSNGAWPPVRPPS